MPYPIASTRPAVVTAASAHLRTIFMAPPCKSDISGTEGRVAEVVGENHGILMIA
jgi:hypothetical protein